MTLEQELTKLAVGLLGRAGSRALAALRSPALGHLGASTVGGAGAGAVGGGLLGAGVGAAQSYRDARAVGATQGEALRSGAVGAVQRGVQGAGLGALSGAALGGALSSRHLPQQLANLPVVGGGARFGQRQLHGLTGWTPEAGIRSIRGGAANAQQTMEDAASKLRSARAAGKDTSKLEGHLERAVGGFEAAADAERRGLTSLPGYARALREDPKGALRAGLREQWQGQSARGKGMLVGAAGLGASMEMGSGQDRGGFERAGRAAGSVVPLMMGSLPIAAGAVVAPAALAAGGFAGRRLDRLRHRPVQGTAAPGPSEVPEGAQQPTERVYTDRAQGVMPEGVA